MLRKIAMATCATVFMVNQAQAVAVPGSVPPITMTTANLYTDDTRGIAIPEHTQPRLQTNDELMAQAQTRSVGATFSDMEGNMINANSQEDSQITDQLERIANDPGFLSMQNNSPMPDPSTAPNIPAPMAPSFGANAMAANMYPPTQGQVVVPAEVVTNNATFNNVNTGFKTIPTGGGFNPGTTMADDGGVEIAAGRVQVQKLDMKNSLVKLREDRVSIRRVLRRMLDQIGGGSWNIVWSLSEENANLPDMEISIYTQEPFMNVLNALLARLQTRSGQSLRVVRYDNSQKLYITDQQGALAKNTKSVGVNVDKDKMLITEQALKDAKVVLHYDEIPLVDALENIVNQASKGQWRLRVYAATDQVLRPAHIEEPFNIAMERILTLFNLKFEIFPGGKVVVVTSDDKTEYANMSH